MEIVFMCLLFAWLFGVPLFDVVKFAAGFVLILTLIWMAWIGFLFCLITFFL
jgi:hypothetical protein